ncbi:MAG: SDR family oxidoreductase [Treponema sp.]|jgi:NAD(P)-dependent dehydrogenase (short-subunit alcohol dehydrogenase family)|nr:SDR family oxidoreductase [Treponema sp.]
MYIKNTCHNPASARCVIVGGSGGIGRALSLALARTQTDDFPKDLSLVIHGGSDSARFDALIARLREETSCPVSKLTQRLNAGDFSGLLESPLYAEVRQADVLCLCFGPFLQKPLHETSAKEWNEISFLNYTLPGICISAALPHMMRNYWGRILVFGGTGTGQIRGFRTNPVYGGAKTALCSLVKSVAISCSQFGITCNAILPGFTETEYLTEAQKEELRAKIPGNTLIAPEQIAEAGLFLLRQGEINGALLNIDQGWI